MVIKMQVIFFAKGNHVGYPLVCTNIRLPCGNTDAEFSEEQRNLILVAEFEVDSQFGFQEADVTAGDGFKLGVVNSWAGNTGVTGKQKTIVLFAEHAWFSCLQKHRNRLFFRRKPNAILSVNRIEACKKIYLS